MIYFNIFDKPFDKNLKNLFSQINPYIISENVNLSFVNIKILLTQNQMTFEYCEIKNSIPLPASIDSIYKSIIKLIIDKSVFIQGFNYYPFRQTISHNEIELKLNHISNLIIRNFHLSKEIGIKKNELYALIWPQDKEIFINKLDTHLTNTKNFIKDNFDIEFKFASKKGIVKLLD